MENVNYKDEITIGKKHPHKVERLILRKNPNGYGYDLIDRIGGSNKGWLFLFYAQTEELCELAKMHLIAGNRKDVELLQEEVKSGKRNPVRTKQILIWKDKHGDSFYSVPTIHDLRKVALHILDLYIKYNWIQKWDLPKNHLDFTKDDIAKMPESLREEATKKIDNFNENYDTYVENNLQYDRAVNALEKKDGQAAWLIIKDRSDRSNDYEYVELITPQTIP